MVGLFYIIRSEYREFAVTPFVVLDIREGVPPRGVDGVVRTVLLGYYGGARLLTPAGILTVVTPALFWCSQCEFPQRN